MATSSRRRSSASKNAPRTARRGEREAEARARHNRVAAEARTASRSADPERAAGTRSASEGGVDLDTGIFSISERGIEPRRDDLSVAEHTANPDKPGDTSVRHAEPPTGKQAAEGAGGYPSGEYDVTKPAPAGSSGKKSPRLAALEAHFADYDINAKVRDHQKRSRLNTDAQLHAIEALPLGAVVEHEGENRWRVRTAVSGINRFGHGKTAAEAIENFILGEQPTLTDAQKAELESKPGAGDVDQDSSGATAASVADVEGRERGIEAGNPGFKAVLEATEGQTARRVSKTKRSAGSSKAKRSGKKK